MLLNFQPSLFITSMLNSAIIRAHRDTIKSVVLCNRYHDGAHDRLWRTCSL